MAGLSASLFVIVLNSLWLWGACRVALGEVAPPSSLWRWAGSVTRGEVGPDICWAFLISQPPLKSLQVLCDHCTLTLYVYLWFLFPHIPALETSLLLSLSFDIQTMLGKWFPQFCWIILPFCVSMLPIELSLGESSNLSGIQTRRDSYYKWQSSWNISTKLRPEQLQILIDIPGDLGEYLLVQMGNWLEQGNIFFRSLLPLSCVHCQQHFTQYWVGSDLRGQH